MTPLKTSFCRLILLSALFGMLPNFSFSQTETISTEWGMKYLRDNPVIAAAPEGHAIVAFPLTLEDQNSPVWLFNKKLEKIDSATVSTKLRLNKANTLSGIENSAIFQTQVFGKVFHVIWSEGASGKLTSFEGEVESKIAYGYAGMTDQYIYVPGLSGSNITMYVIELKTKKVTPIPIAGFKGTLRSLLVDVDTGTATLSAEGDNGTQGVFVFSDKKMVQKVMLPKKNGNKISVASANQLETGEWIIAGTYTHIDKSSSLIPADGVFIAQANKNQLKWQKFHNYAHFREWMDRLLEMNYIPITFRGQANGGKDGKFSTLFSMTPAKVMVSGDKVILVLEQFNKVPEHRNVNGKMVNVGATFDFMAMQLIGFSIGGDVLWDDYLLYSSSYSVPILSTNSKSEVRRSGDKLKISVLNDLGHQHATVDMDGNVDRKDFMEGYPEFSELKILGSYYHPIAAYWGYNCILTFQAQKQKKADARMKLMRTSTR